MIKNCNQHVVILYCRYVKCIEGTLLKNQVLIQGFPPKKVIIKEKKIKGTILVYFIEFSIVSNNSIVLFVDLTFRKIEGCFSLNFDFKRLTNVSSFKMF